MKSTLRLITYFGDFNYQNLILLLLMLDTPFRSVCDFGGFAILDVLLFGGSFAIWPGFHLCIRKILLRCTPFLVPLFRDA